MVDIARLGVAVDSSDLARGKTALKGFATEGKRTEAQIVKSADRMERELAQTAVATGNLNKNMRGGLGGSRMMAMQLSQVAQQGSVTGNYLQALAVQLPDLALGLGTVGILAGAAAGALLPLAMNMFGAADGAKEYDDALDAVIATQSRLGESNELLNMSMAEMVVVYGNAAAGIREFALLQAELRIAESSAMLNSQVSVLNDISAGYRDAAVSGYGLEEAISRIQQDFGLSVDAASQFRDILVGIAAASGLDEQVTLLSEMRSLLEESGVSASNIPPEFAAALDEMISLARETAAAEKLASDLAASAAEVAPALGPAVTTASALRAELAAALSLFNAISRQESKVYSGRGQDPRRFEDGGNLSDYESELGYKPVSQIITDLTPKARKGGGRSSAASKAAREAQRAQNELNRDAERIIEGLKSEQEKYNDSLEQAKRLLDAGALSQEQYNEHVKQLGVEFQNQQPFIQEWKDSILDAAMGGADAFDALKDSIIRAGLEYALFGTGVFAPKGSTGGGGLLGSLFGGLLNFDGGGFTGSGSRTGGIDGKGGMMAMVHPNETVIDHTKGQAAGGGQMDVRVYVDQDGNWQAKVEQISGGVVQRAAPGIAAQSVKGAKASFRNSKSGWSP